MGVAKAALESVSRYLARDLGAAGVRVNLVSAGPVETPAAEGIPGFDKLAALWGEQAPLGWDTSDPAPGGGRRLLPAVRPGARRSAARSCTWTAASTRWARRRSRRSMLDVAPIMPARDLVATAAFYERLGFEQSGLWPGEYLIVHRGEVWLHFFSSPELDPWSSDAGCYVYVEDAMPCSPSSWLCLCRATGIPRLQGPPNDSDYGLREFALVDPDGNLLRIGSFELGRPAIIPAPVLLAIDVGNTQTHLGMFRDEQLLEHWRFATVRFATADELATMMASLLDLRGLRLAEVDAAIVSSVVPTLAHEYEQLIERYLDGNGALVGPGLKTGMPIRIDTPQELGPDRLANAVAAYDRVGGACIAVDFGTAINYDVVSSAGEYLGGVISPGIEISLEALAARAARLPRVDIEEPRHAIGKGTKEAIQAGVVYGFAGQVDGILAARARGARRGGHHDRHGRLRRGHRPLVRPGRRGGRAPHPDRPEADLGTKPQLSRNTRNPQAGAKARQPGPHGPLSPS